MVREKPQKIMAKKSSTCLRIPSSMPQHKTDREDSESTHHSNASKPLEKKLTKEEKRHRSLESIHKLIESRKADTLNELDRMDDEEIVLKSSPKKHSSNLKLSHFRGVSNNGKKWQVMIMGFAKKIYFGGINSEMEASHKYDKYAVLMHGLEVRYNNYLLIYL